MLWFRIWGCGSGMIARGVLKWLELGYFDDGDYIVCFQIIGVRFFEMIVIRGVFKWFEVRYVEVTEMKCVEAAQLELCV